MLEYLGRRILQLLVVLFLASIFVFLILRLAPGDPAVLMGGDEATPEMIEAIRREMGLDKPVPVQYLIWLSKVARGDLGNSYITHYPVSELIAMRLPVTVHLTVASLFVALLISVPGGILSALYPGSVMDVAFSIYSGLRLTLPVFWLGILLIIVFALKLKVLPPSSFVSVTENPIQCVRHLILPALTLGTGSGAVQTRFFKSAILEVIGEDYVRTAHAKGLRRGQVISRHILRNAAIPAVTIVGLQFASLLAGTVLTETIFVLPGVGRLIVHSVIQKDYTVVQGTVLFISTVFILVNLLVDITYGVLDPRIRYG